MELRAKSRAELLELAKAQFDSLLVPGKIVYAHVFITVNNPDVFWNDDIPAGQVLILDPTTAISSDGAPINLTALREVMLDCFNLETFWSENWIWIYETWFDEAPL